MEISELDSGLQCEIVAGVDEVGRGPLAGDVVAAAVILGDSLIEGLTDSKLLTTRRRVDLALEIKRTCISWSLGRASVIEIDEINILQASLLAMQRAVESLSTRPTLVLVDGDKLPNWSYPARAVIRGDVTEPVISAASILAKVHRDREMGLLDQKYPQYGFINNKGYPTAMHLKALKRFGVSPMHRRSFGPVKRLLCESDQG